MMVKLAQAGEGGGCTPTPFHFIYHLVQSCGVRSSREGRYTRPLFLLYTIYMYSVVQSHAERRERGDWGEYVHCTVPKSQSPLKGVRASLKMGFQLALCTSMNSATGSYILLVLLGRVRGWRGRRISSGGER
jgi:hypothetical protein